MPTYEDLINLLARVSDEFHNLSELDSPETVSPNEKLWDEVDNARDALKNENSM